MTLPAKPSSSLSAADVAAGTRLRFCVRGLLGGHSGINIGDDRGNAVILAARIADAAASAAGAEAEKGKEDVAPLLITTAKGGDKRNALARECAIEAWIPHSPSSPAAAAVLGAARGEAAAIKEEYGTLEKEIEVIAEVVVDEKASSPSSPPPPLPPLDPQTSDSLLSLLLTLPHGVIKKSHAVNGLVESSTNLASVSPVFAAEESSPTSAAVSAFKISCSTRSSFMPALEATRRAISRVAAACGATAERGEAYPGWAADPSAPLVSLAREAVEGVTGRPARVGAIHAGLECGLIKVRRKGCSLGGRGERERETKKKKKKKKKKKNLTSKSKNHKNFFLRQSLALPCETPSPSALRS